LDLLDHLDEIKVCTGYKTRSGEIIKGRLPASIKEFGQLEANYEVLKGWKTDTTKVKRFDELPTEAQSFVKFVEKKTKKEVTFVSVSADEDEGILRTRLN
jgi:adenylosuccinate synthase